MKSNVLQLKKTEDRNYAF